MTAQHEGWVSLGTPADELLLANTLVTGQSFRWRRTDDISSPYDTYTGVIGQRLVQMRQLPGDVQYRVLARSATEDPAADAAVLQDYFNLGTSLGLLSQHWATQDTRYAHVAPALPGCRMLRQDPVECLFQFVCSSNNHISRIHGMVERLCSNYGSPLLPDNGSSSRSGSVQLTEQQQQQQQSGLASSLEQCLSPGTPAAAAGAASWPANQQQQQVQAPSLIPLPFSDLGYTRQQPAQPQKQQQQVKAGEGLPSFYAFPTLEQLAAATEDALRADGFGYRAKYIVGSVQQLLEKTEGGRTWLLSLRDKPYAEAHVALCSLPGVGPKVAACICLFSLDKHDAIPVDTHVWDLAAKYYAPHLAKKSLTPKLHAEVQQAFVDRFGPYAGWAHNCLFISELASHRHLLPAAPRKGTAAAAAAGAAAAPSAAAVGQQRKRKSLELPVEALILTANTDGLLSPAASTAVKQEDSQVAAGVLTPAAPGQAAGAAVAGNQGGGVAGRRRRRPTKKMEEAVAAAAAAAGLQLSQTSATACAGIVLLDSQV